LQLGVEELEKRQLLATSLAAPLHFDFGTSTSAVAAGYTAVSLKLYSNSVGYGWQSHTGLIATDRGTSDPLTSAFVRGKAGTFLINLPNGTYDITPTLGDSKLVHDQVAVYAQGQLLASGLETDRGQFITPTYEIDVTNGQLALRFVDGGGATPRFALDALDVATPANNSPDINSSQFAISATGVYALGMPDKPTPSAIYSNPAVDGIAIRATWDYIETGNGVYNWSYLDSEVNAAINAGKKMSLSVVPGINTPSWVFAAGAQSFSYSNGSSGATQKIPVPWDSVYLAKWEGFIQALGKRYSSKPGLMSVKITGINADTGEIYLPISATDTRHWQAAGYTPDKVMGAWQAIVDTWVQAFPGKQVTMMQIPQGFPTIDNNGEIYSNQWGADVQIVNTMIDYGISAYGSLFSLQNNGLSDQWISGQVVNLAPALTTGYQMFWWVTGDNQYKMNGGTPVGIVAELQNAVNLALSNHAQYLEFYTTDLTNPALQNVFVAAQDGLAKNALPTAPFSGLPASGHSPEGTAVTVTAQSVADPSTVNTADFTYAWCVTKDGHAYKSGSGTSFTFKPNDDGTYVVTLTVTDNQGRTGVGYSQTLKVDKVAPTPTISGPTKGQLKETLTFQGLVTDPSSVDMAAGFTYFWHFGDGIGGEGQRVTHAYKRTGTYTVTLTVWDADGCWTKTTLTVTVS
jgi:hypothetical protein